MDHQDLSFHLARHVAKTRFEDLPQAAVDTAKKSILDLLGVSLAASGTIPAIKGVMEFVRAHGGTPHCSVLGFEDRLPPAMAAFANGAMAHCLDYDDVAPDGNHASSSLIPAVLAVAEFKGAVSGKQLITAVALGQDIFLRLRRSLHQRLDWLVTTVLGVFSATAAVSYVLTSSEEQIAHSLGIATLSSSGTLEMRFGTGSDLGELYAGFVAKSAVMAGMLAAAGITGVQKVFEGQAGIMPVYFGNDYDRSKVLEGLGEDFYGRAMQYKPWPVCGIANTYIHAVLKGVREKRIGPGDIVAIRPFVGDFQQRMCKPLNERCRPSGAMDARFSLPFCLAVAAVYGDVKVEHFGTASLTDPAVLAMTDKVTPIDDSAFDWVGAMPEARVEIDLKNGETFVATSEGTPGSASNPLGWDDLVRKFHHCASLAANPKPAATRVKVTDMLSELEGLDDVAKLMRLICEPSNVH
ncbi:MmgE/PrpD family protein [Rhizobium sp. BK456]|uniref:MmgE/PrpD family protein n=1 Tax=Rhizobium sp. BK456 TaxID=2587007 RepID=UPI001610C395|nr:MmgE/PrpD family protein [Rhizobium sp. BK456]MBB3526980.1 2-methylcitrate dehydratase PrpD [Rhizobium sp. BK456]